MLIGTSSKKPNLETIRRIKKALRETLALPEHATVTVAELACLEAGCAPQVRRELSSLIKSLLTEYPRQIYASPRHFIHYPPSNLRFLPDTSFTTPVNPILLMARLQRQPASNLPL